MLHSVTSMTTSYELFVEVLRCSFLGGRHTVNGKEYVLEPTILRRYDFIQQDPSFGQKSEMYRKFSDMPDCFRNTARSEMYRKDGGWIRRGYDELKVKQYDMNGEAFLVPIMDKRTVGIDTSSYDGDTYVCMGFFDNPHAGYHYVERFLEIPRSREQPSEFRWNKTNAMYRKRVTDNLEELLKISCDVVLMIKTNALIKPAETTVDIFVKLVEGWFTNYDYIGQKRTALRDRLFALADSTPVHCDSDFSPLSPSKVTRQLVRILSAGRPYEPLYATKESHESEPIQLADVLCGALARQIMDKKTDILTPWEFHNRLRSKKDEKTAKCHYWRF